MIENAQNSIKRLRWLAGKEKLSTKELNEAKELMKELRSFGFGPDEISAITNERWAKPTIREYTKGQRVVNPTPKHTITSLIDEMEERGLTIDDLHKASEAITLIEEEGENLETILSALKLLGKRNVQFSDFIDLVQQYKKSDLTFEKAEKVSVLLEMAKTANLQNNYIIQAISYLLENADSTDSLRELVDYVNTAVSMNINAKCFIQIHEEIKKLGSPEEVLNELSIYRNIKEIQNEHEKIQQELTTSQEEAKILKSEIEKLKNEFEKAEVELAPKRKALELYHTLETEGYELEVLKKLSIQNQKHGGITSLLDGIEKYKSVIEIENQKRALEEDLEKIKTKFKKLEADYAHLSLAINLCEKLLNRKFGLQALETIENCAEKYGEPIVVLRAIETYGELKLLQKEITNARSELEKIQKECNVLKHQSEDMKKVIGFIQTLVKLEYTYEDIKGFLDLAKKYGRGSDVLKALHEYGKMEGLKREIQKLDKSIYAKNKEIEEKDRFIAERNGVLKGVEDEIQELAERTAEYSRKVGEVEQYLKTHEDKLQILKLLSEILGLDKSTVKDLVILLLYNFRNWIDANKEKIGTHYSNVLQKIDWLIDEVKKI